MFTNYVELEFRFEPAQGGGFAFSVRGAGGEERGTFVPPLDDAAYLADSAMLAGLTSDEELLTRVGTTLFSRLFSGNVKSVYARAQGQLGEDTGLRIKLTIPPGETALAALPWELLNDPDQGPLAMLDAPIVRYLPQQAVIPQLKTSLPLRVLLTSATPVGYESVAAELATVRQSLEELAAQGLVSFVVEEQLSSQVLQRRLREGFQIWHFVGYSGQMPNGKSALMLAKPGGDALVGADQLGILLNRSELRLVVLASCSERNPNATVSFRELALPLIKAQLPAVVTMQFANPLDATSAFAGEFYKALAEGFPIDACVTEGRKAVMFATGLGAPDWGLPVVYTRAADGQLFDLPTTPSGQPATAVPGSTLHVSGLGQGNTVSHSTVSTTVNLGGPAQPVESAISDEDRQLQIAGLLERIKAKRRRLNILQVQEATRGDGTDPAILMEIEDITGELQALARELAALGGA